MDLTKMGNEVVDALVGDLVQQKETLEAALPQPFGVTEAPMAVRLQRYSRSLTPEAMRALVKVFGRRQVVKEVLELHPELMKAVHGATFGG